MPHILAKLNGIKAELIKEILRRDAAQHAEQGMYLQHLWQNVDDDEVLFLFRTDDHRRARKFIDRVHSQALRENPSANLPQMTFLEEK